MSFIAKNFDLSILSTKIMMFLDKRGPNEKEKSLVRRAFTLLSAQLAKEAVCLSVFGPGYTLHYYHDGIMIAEDENAEFAFALNSKLDTWPKFAKDNLHKSPTMKACFLAAIERQSR